MIIHLFLKLQFSFVIIALRLGKIVPEIKEYISLITIIYGEP
jgi:hypothetical protein